MTLDQRLTRAAHHVADGVTVPEVDLTAVRSTARASQRRKVAVAAVAAVAAAVVTVGLAAGGLWHGDRAQEPVQQPSPSQSGSPTADGGWTPERIRAEGSQANLPEFRTGPSSSGLDAQLYCVASNCGFLDGELDRRWALEVTQGDQSALFDVRGIPWGKDLDDDSILVQDGTDQRVRFRLLQADGSAVRLRMDSHPAFAAPGPDVMLIDALDVYRRGYVGPDDGARPYLVDDRTATLRPLSAPEEIKGWGPNVDEFLWGADGCRVIWQQADGTFDHHDVGCGHPGLTDIPGEYSSDLDHWLQPGRMVLLEHDAEGVPLVVHASLDRGATWKRIEVEHRFLNGNSSLAQLELAFTDALDKLD